MLKRSLLFALASALLAAASFPSGAPKDETWSEAYHERTPSPEIDFTTVDGLEPDAAAEGAPLYEVSWMIVSGGGVSQGQGTGDPLDSGGGSPTEIELEYVFGQAVVGTSTGEGGGSSYELTSGLLKGSTELFSDDFECGNLCAWSSSSSAAP